MRVHRDWCFEAFVDVKILRAGDNLLSSAAGKPRYLVYSSRVCVENRCVSTPPARKGQVESRALDSARYFFFYVRVLQPARFRYTKANGNIPLPEAPTFPSGVNSNHQRAMNTHVYDRFPLIRMRPINKSDELFEGQGNVGEARPTKHTKFKTNKLTTAASQDQSQKPQQE